MMKVIAVGINHTMFIIEMSSELVTMNGVIDKPMQLPRTMASVMPPLAIAGVQFNRHLRAALTSALTLALTHNQKTCP